jgi:hypothetical protein
MTSPTSPLIIQIISQTRKMQVPQERSRISGMNSVERTSHYGSSKDPSSENMASFQSKRELQQFLGFCNYYRKFMKDFPSFQTLSNYLLVKTTGIGPIFNKMPLKDFTTNCLQYQYWHYPTTKIPIESTVIPPYLLWTCNINP